MPDDPELTLDEWGDVVGRVANNIISQLTQVSVQELTGSHRAYLREPIKAEAEVIIEVTAGKGRNRWRQATNKTEATVSIRGRAEYKTIIGEKI